MAGISIYDCMVRVDKESPYVWVAYQQESPHLPVAVADTARELAKAVGVPENNVVSVASKHRHGKIKRPRYMCVFIGGV